MPNPADPEVLANLPLDDLIAVYYTNLTLPTNSLV